MAIAVSVVFLCPAPLAMAIVVIVIIVCVAWRVAIVPWRWWIIVVAGPCAILKVDLRECGDADNAVANASAAIASFFMFHSHSGLRIVIGKAVSHASDP